jgi:hypothetical protein
MFIISGVASQKKFNAFHKTYGKQTSDSGKKVIFETPKPCFMKPISFFIQLFFIFSFVVFFGSCHNRHNMSTSEENGVTEQRVKDDVPFKPLMLKGNVGPYSVEMEILSSDPISGRFEGKYKYLSKKEYLDLEGSIYGSCLQINEYYNGRQTGSFYLEREVDGLTGWWTHEKNGT